MNTTILITLGLATALSMSGCVAAKRTADTDQGIPSVTQAVVTEATTTTTAAHKEEKAAVKIDVTDAVDRSFKIADETFTYKIPKVTITGVNTDAANETIRTEIDKEYYDGDNKELFDSNYEYFVGNKTVSLVVPNTDLSGGEFITVKVYNVDINTGKLLTAGEVVKLSGMTDDEFFGKVKGIYTKYNNEEYKRCSGKEEKSYISENLKNISYKFVQPYFGANGKLCFIGEVNCTAGAGVAYESFETA